jgi:multidrug efflux system membrane fusion protein
MFRYALPLALPVSLAFLLTACGHEEVPQVSVRPAMVVQPEPSAQAMESYPVKFALAMSRTWRSALAAKSADDWSKKASGSRPSNPWQNSIPRMCACNWRPPVPRSAAAEANLNLVRSERDRYKTLMDRQLVSRSQYDNAENLYRSGEARLKQIKAEFNVSTNQASYAVLRAPQDGVVAKRAVEVGQVVAAGQTVFTLATDGEREVLISLPEQSFGRFKVGQPVSVELWTQPDQRFAGHIRELSPSADPKSRTFAARIAFAGGKVPLNWARAPGCSCKLLKGDPLSVPLSALTAENGVAYVWVVSANNTLKKTPVRVGPSAKKTCRCSKVSTPATGWWPLASMCFSTGSRYVPVDRSNRVVNLADKE